MKRQSPATNEKVFQALLSVFRLHWYAAVLAEPNRQQELLRQYAFVGLVERHKNGRVKLNLTRLGEVAFDKAIKGEFARKAA